MSRRAARPWSVLAGVVCWLVLPSPAVAQSAPFTLVALPDTQHYTCSDGSNCVADEEIFEAQTEWIAAQRDLRDIRFVTGLGDCVQDGDDTAHFVIADAALATLELASGPGYPDGIPYGLAVGNRDQFPSGEPGSIPSVSDVLHPGQATTTEEWNSWFGVDRFCPDGACRSYYGDHFGLNNDNHFDLFEADAYSFVVVHVEYMPSDSDLRDAVIAWAGDVLTTHADRRAIVVSHHVLGTGTDAAFSDQGAALYEGLKTHPNLFLILGGHVSGEGRRTDVFEGHVVHTMLSDYQSRADGGQGWLRLLEFRPAEDLISVRTYSPWLDAWETDGSSEFTLDYDLSVVEPDAPATLDHTAITSGRFTTLTLRGAPPGAKARFLKSTTGDDGTERCLPGAPTVCTTLRRPVLLGTVTVDGAGEASLRTWVAATLKGATLYLQGQWVADGTGEATAIEAVIVP